MNVYAELLQREDCLMLLVDIQQVLLDPCVEKDRVRKNADALITIANLFDIPVLFTENNAEKLGGFLPELLGKVASPKVFNKLEFSCFENEPITRAMDETGRQTLILAGIESHVCIFHTGAYALRLGYRVHVVADAVSSRNEFNYKTGIKRLERAGAVITSTEMVVYELLKRAGTPEFRAALPLLKTL